ncbi:MAG: DUF2793 domain-containing protein, partial [Litoreibacter sp.]|nr:DUF2793 domain-containing protein [Litoreibacter sp.]
MSETSNLKLPLVAPSQAQKHVTVNEALARIDAVVQISAVSRSLATPPANPSEADTYLVALGGTDAWLGADGEIASFINGGWHFVSPVRGWRVWIDDEALNVSFDGAEWRANVVAQAPSGAAMRGEIIEFDHVLTGGAGSEDTAVVIPAQTCVWGVTGRVLSEFTGGLSDWSLGVAGSDDRYGSGLGKGTGAWLRGLTGQPVTYYNDTPLRLTANGGSFSGGAALLDFGNPWFADLGI